MPRLGSEKDLMYVPTDLGVVEEIANLFGALGRFEARFNEEGSAFRIFDPCAGAGHALEAFGKGVWRAMSRELDDAAAPVETWGFEIENKRAKSASTRLTRCRTGDFLSASIEQKSFHAVWANPPYGIDRDLKRLEHRFLARVTPLLKNNGILVYIVPRSSIKVSARFLAKRFWDFRVWDPGHIDSERYNQVVLVAQLCDNERPLNIVERDRIELEDFAAGRIDSIGVEGPYEVDMSSRRYCLPYPTKGRPNPFDALMVDYGAVLGELDASGYMTTRAWADVTQPQKARRIRPLMPQMTGHMAQILSANLIGDAGVPLYEEGQPGRYVFRVSTEKVAVTKTDKENNRKTITEKPRTALSLLDLDTFEYIDDIDPKEITFRYRHSLASYVESNMPARYHPSKMDRPDYSQFLRRPLPGNGQRLVIEGTTFALREGEPNVIVSCDMGTGKTYISIVAGHLSGKRRVLVLCPPIMVDKWRKEARETIPGVNAYVVGEKQGGDLANHPFYKMHGDRLKQLDWLKERFHGKREDESVYVIMGQAKGKMSFSRMPAVVWRWGYRPQPEINPATGKFIPQKFRGFDRRMEDAIRSAVANKDDKSDDSAKPKVTLSEGKAEYVKRMCCPECFMPIVDEDDLPRDWDWIGKAWRRCDNEIVVGKKSEGRGGGKRWEVATRPCGAPLWQAFARNVTGIVDTGIGLRGQMLHEQRQKAAYAYEALPSTARLIGYPRADYSPSIEAQAHVDSMSIIGGKRLPPRRFDLGEYIKRAMGGMFDLLIVDEIHQYKGRDTAQARLASVLSDVVPQHIALTGTFMAGYAENMFRMLYHFGPRSIRSDFSFTMKEWTRWSRLYGFVAKEMPLERRDASTNKVKGGGDRTNPQPGALPDVLKYYLPNAVFMRLEDVATDLPPFEELHISVPMSTDNTDSVDDVRSQRSSYDYGMNELVTRNKELAFSSEGRARASLRSLTAQFGMVYPETATTEAAGYVYLDALQEVVVDMPPLRAGKIYPKERKLLDLIKSERELGRRCLVYVTHTGRRDVIPRLEDLFKREGIDYASMRAEKMQASQRIDWIERQVSAGIDALVCHAQLVEVGVDLLDFPTIIWYELSYSVPTIRQASRRSWRPGQNLPVRVYYLTYEESKQTFMLHWISKKVQVSRAIEGNVQADGLSGMGDDDAMYQIERMLVESGLDYGEKFEDKLVISSSGDNDENAGALVVSDADIWDLEAAETDGGITADAVDELMSVEDELIEDALVIDGVARLVEDDDDIVIVSDGSDDESGGLDDPVADDEFGGGADDEFADGADGDAVDAAVVPIVAPVIAPVIAPMFVPEPALERGARGEVDLDIWVSAFGMTKDEMREGAGKRRGRRRRA